jgi:hypothetical protein
MWKRQVRPERGIVFSNTKNASIRDLGRCGKFNKNLQPQIQPRYDLCYWSKETGDRRVDYNSMVKHSPSIVELHDGGFDKLLKKKTTTIALDTPIPREYDITVPLYTFPNNLRSCASNHLKLAQVVRRMVR